MYCYWVMRMVGVQFDFMAPYFYRNRYCSTFREADQMNISLGPANLMTCEFMYDLLVN